MSTPEPRPEPRPSDASPAAATSRGEESLLRGIREARSGDFTTRARGMLEHGRRALLAERGSLWLADGDRLVCAARAPAAAESPPRVPADPAWLEALQAVRARVVPEGATHPVRRALGGGSGSVLEAPVIGAAGAAGIVVFERSATRGPFRRADVALAAAIADREAVLVEWRGRNDGAATLAGREAHLHEVQRMQALGRLTTGVAHDFNNALTAILGGVQLVADGLPSQSDLQGTATRTLDAIEFAADLARQLLDFGRGDPRDLREVGLDDVIERFAHLLRTLLGDRRRLELRLGAGSARVRAAPTRLAQVVLNLVSNARDALPDEGVVTIETAELGERIVLRVTDDGVGIHPDVIVRIFEPLFTTKAVGQGCGLGLATVRHVVDELGGSIAVESEPGRGTTFELRFPRA